MPTNVELSPPPTSLYPRSRRPSPRVPFLSDTSNETADDAPHIREAPRPVPGLLVVWSVDAPQHRACPLTSATGTYEIGRSSAAVIDFPNDPAMSGLHCDVQVDGDALVIRDRGGRNGTYLNGAPIHGTVRTPLAERGVLRAGTSRDGRGQRDHRLALRRRERAPAHQAPQLRQLPKGPRRGRALRRRPWRVHGRAPRSSRRLRGSAPRSS